MGSKYWDGVKGRRGICIWWCQRQKGYLYAGFCPSGPCRGVAQDHAGVMPFTLFPGPYRVMPLALAVWTTTEWFPWPCFCGLLVPYMVTGDAPDLACGPLDPTGMTPLTLMCYPQYLCRGDTFGFVSVVSWLPQWCCPAPGLFMWSLDSHRGAALDCLCGPLTPTGVLFWTVHVVPWLPQGCCFGLFMWSLDSHRGAVLDCLCGLLTPTGVLPWTVYVVPWLPQGCCSGLCLCDPLTPTGVLFWTLFMWSLDSHRGAVLDFVYVIPWLPQGCCSGLFMWSPSVITYMVEQAALLSSHSVATGSPQGTVYKWLHRHWHNTSHKILWWFCNRRYLQLRLFYFAEFERLQE